MAVEFNQRVESVKLHYLERLKDLNQKTQFVANLKSKFGNSLNIVMIGHGENPIEISALKEFLLPEGFNLNFQGFELKEDLVARCRTKYKNDSSCKFDAVNAADYQKILKIMDNKKAHLVILRHPVLDPRRHDLADPFFNTFTKTVAYLLEKDACLMVSIFLPAEAPRCQWLLSKIHDGEVFYSKQDGVYWGEDFTSIKYGYDNFTTEKNELYCEKHFFAITEFSPVPLLQRERQGLKSNAGSSVNSIENQVIINETVDKFIEKLHQYKYQHSARSVVVTQFLKTLVDFFSMWVPGENFSKELFDSVIKCFEGLTSEKIDSLKNVEDEISVIAWHFLRWDEHPQFQKQLAENIVEALVSLSEDKGLNEKNAEQRGHIFKDTLDLLLQGRPFCESGEAPKPQQKVQPAPLSPQFLW